MRDSDRSFRRDDGYTLLELLIAVGFITVVSAISLAQIGAIRPGLKSDGAMRRVMGELNAAREMAISQRRLVEVAFTGVNRIVVTRQEVPAGTTVLVDVPFEGGVQYGVVTGIRDTPDAFGNAKPVSFGAAARMLFNTEGQLVDTTGKPVNGTVFLVLPNDAVAFRAVTVLGSTGRVRGFRWNGSQWTRV